MKSNVRMSKLRRTYDERVSNVRLSFIERMLQKAPQLLQDFDDPSVSSLHDIDALDRNECTHSADGIVLL